MLTWIIFGVIAFLIALCIATILDDAYYNRNLRYSTTIMPYGLLVSTIVFFVVFLIGLMLRGV